MAHEWKVTPEQAVALQQQMATSVVKDSLLGRVSIVVGVDASYEGGRVHAAAVALTYPDQEVLETVRANRPVEFPYVPGLLSFREGPAILDALSRLKSTPDLLICDAHGIAHPRRFGIASHIGVMLNLPSIGCAKTRLCGEYEVPGPERGEYTYLRDGEETIGAVLRTRRQVKPVFVSTGHRVDLPTSIAYVLACCRGYRLPEPTRRADHAARYRTVAGKEAGSR